jgi:poly-beta-1,6 N-acetyl-D-glucosamine synthase
MKQNIKPVFYDRNGKRWRIFLAILFLIVSVVGVSLSYTTLHILEGTNLLNLPFQKNALVVNAADIPADTLSFEKLKTDMQLNAPVVPFTPESTQSVGAKQVIAYFVNWDDKSFLSLQRNSKYITKLMPEWLHLKDSLGGVELNNRSKQIQVVEFLSKIKSAIKIIPLLNNYNPDTDTWDDLQLTQTLSNSEARANLINNLFSYVKDNNFAGINIDFGDYSTNINPYLATFMSTLLDKFHSAGLEVSMSLPADEESVNYADVLKYTDYIILMAYDEHWATAVPGPIASQAWFSTVLRKRVLGVPRDKLVIGLGNYGYDWQLGQTEGLEITFQDVMHFLQNNTAPANFDAYFLNPHLTYNDVKGIPHNVWYLDGTTFYNQLKTAQKFNLAGFALWRLGSEDPSIWQLIENLDQPSESQIAQLENMPSGYGSILVGNGGIIKAVDFPKDGKRTLTYDKISDLIYNESITDYGNPISIQTTDKSELKSVALTFDDGPDEVYTAEILDILKHYKIKATFFVIGTNASLHTSLLKRIYNEGHEIGIHTFTHPDISKITDDQLAMEINSSQELLKSKLNIKSLLFRPPYGEDNPPRNPEEIRPLKKISEMGYYNILMGVDPNDWADPGTNKIVDSTVSQVESGEGSIILLHDSGGDRSQTVEALPLIINKLTTLGYNFVTVSYLLGMSRDQVMIKDDTPKFLGFNISSIGFDIFSSAFQTFRVIFFLGTILGIYKLFAIIFFAFLQKKFKHKGKNKTYKPFVSVLIPAFNEEKVIVRTINNVLSSNYKNLEILVINDGSSDNTCETVTKAFKDNDKVHLINARSNVGKSEALNLGVRNSKGPIVVVQDADSIIRKNTISTIVSHFSDKTVGAVAGNIRVGNRVNILTKLQALEYVSGQNLDRRAYDLLNCVTVVPGAIGAWRKSVIKKAGYFSSRTLAEDAELTIRIVSLGYRVVYEENAIAYTEAPQDIKSFMKQRFRWAYGTLQYVRLYYRKLFNPSYEFLGLFSLPSILIFHIIFSLIGPFIDLYFFSSLFYNLWQKSIHPGFSLNTLYINISAYLLFFLVDVVTQFIAFYLDNNREYKLILWLPFQRIFYRQILYIVAFKTILTAIKGPMVSWNKLERSGVLTHG